MDYSIVQPPSPQKSEAEEISPIQASISTDRHPPPETHQQFHIEMEQQKRDDTAHLEIGSSKPTDNEIHENEELPLCDVSPQQISGTQEPRASSDEDAVKLN